MFQPVFVFGDVVLTLNSIESDVCCEESDISESVLLNTLVSMLYDSSVRGTKTCPVPLASQPLCRLTSQYGGDPSLHTCSRIVQKLEQLIP